MKYFRADYIHPQKTLAFTGDLHKINLNLGFSNELIQQIDTKKASRPTSPFSLMTVAGRWLVLYSANGENDEDTMMYFIDFRIELDNSAVSNLISEGAIRNLKVLQHRYDQVYKDEMDTIDVSQAETWENIIKGNLVACESDEKVLEKAKALGALPIIGTIKPPDKIKVTLVDEKIGDGEEIKINAYALVHFAKTDDEDAGFAYFKIHDIVNNIDLIGEFLSVLESLAPKFDRTFFMEKFGPERWN